MRCAALALRQVSDPIHHKRCICLSGYLLISLRMPADACSNSRIALKHGATEVTLPKH